MNGIKTRGHQPITMTAAVKRLVSLTALLFLVSCTQLIRPNFTPVLTELRAGEYQLDKMHSFLLFRIEHLGLSKIVGRFNTFDASLDFDPSNPEAMTLNGIIAADSIDINNPDLESTLQEPDWFDSEQFPQLVFESNTVEVIEDNKLAISGLFTMRGITQPLTLIATFNGGADNLITRKYTIGFSATALVNRSDFGMDTFSAFAGDEIEVELHGEFLRQ